MALRRVLQSRIVVALGLALAVLVPALTVPRLPHVSPWPLLAGLVPWVIGKYVLCPLRWRALTTAVPAAPRARRWYLRAYAESELLGLLTPGHVGADIWRLSRLNKAGLARGDALISVGVDRIVGGIGVTVFVMFAATSLPSRVLVISAAVGVVAVAVALVARRLFPRLLPSGPLPRPRALLVAFLLAAGYQLTIAGLLFGTIAATGHTLPPLTVLAAFGASQLAGVVPGLNGASPKDGALVVALVALGLPLVAAAAAVTIRATLAWLPAITIGGLSLWLWRRQATLAPA